MAFFKREKTLERKNGDRLHIFFYKHGMAEPEKKVISLSVLIKRWLARKITVARILISI